MCKIRADRSLVEASRGLFTNLFTNRFTIASRVTCSPGKARTTNNTFTLGTRRQDIPVLVRASVVAEPSSDQVGEEPQGGHRARAACATNEIGNQ